MIDERFCRHVLIDLQIGASIKKDDVLKAFDWLLNREDNYSEIENNYKFLNEQFENTRDDLEDISRIARKAMNAIDDKDKEFSLYNAFRAIELLT